MPTCPKCRVYVADGERCERCSLSIIEHTAIDHKLVQRKAELMCPEGRAPTAKLTVLDDDSECEGELIRIRRSSFSIGRKDCDLDIPHDGDMSASHAVIRREQISQSGWSWKIIDQSSTNGTFVRVAQWPLGQRLEFYLGALPLRWVASETETESEIGRLEVLENPLVQPALLSCLDRGGMIGASQTTSDIIVCHPTIDDAHARIEKRSGQWLIRDCESRNGIWVRVEQAPLNQNTVFMLGQQRFSFSLPKKMQNSVGGLSLEVPG